MHLLTFKIQNKYNDLNKINPEFTWYYCGGKVGDNLTPVDAVKNLLRLWYFQNENSSKTKLKVVIGLLNFRTMIPNSNEHVAGLG
jgi:hypothetical protein